MVRRGTIYGYDDGEDDDIEEEESQEEQQMQEAIDVLNANLYNLKQNRNDSQNKSQDQDSSKS